MPATPSRPSPKQGFRFRLAMLAGFLLLAPSMHGPAMAQTDADRAAVVRAIGEQKADALLTVWNAVNALGDGWAKGKFEADRAAELAASYHDTAARVRELVRQPPGADRDAKTAAAGARSLLRQAGTLRKWIASGARSPPQGYLLQKTITDKLLFSRQRAAQASPAKTEAAPQRQEVQLSILTSRQPDGSPGPLGKMTVVHTSHKAPVQITWTYPDGTSDTGLGVPVPGTGMLATSFGKGAKSIHIYRLAEPGKGPRRIDGLWVPAHSRATIEKMILLGRDGGTLPTSFMIVGNGGFSTSELTEGSALEVKWTFPMGDIPGIGVMSGDYIAAIAISPGERGGVALYSMAEDGSGATSRWVISGSEGVGAEELAMIRMPAAKADPVPPAGSEAEIRAIAEAIRDDLGNAARWKPTTSQINAISRTLAAADKLRAYVRAVYGELSPGVAGAKPGQTEIIVTGPDLSELAGGYQKESKHFRPGIEIYGFTFVEPGKKTGMRYDGLIRVNGEWIFIPKAWRAFR